MPKVIENDEGNEIEVFTAEEVAAQKAALEAEYKAKLADKDEHVKTKLAEFQVGKTSAESKEKEFETQMQEAKRIAEEAKQMAAEAKAHGQTESDKRINILKDYTMEQYGGADPEIKKKLDEAYAMINKEIGSDADVVDRVRLAANMAGLAGGAKTVNTPMYGGYAPNVKTVNEQEANNNYGQFVDALGLEDFIKKPNE